MRKVYGLFLVSILLFTGFGCSDNPAGWIPQSAEPVSGIAFVADDGTDRDIHLIQPDGSGRIVLIGTNAVDSDPAFSPDGRTLAFRSRRDGSSEIYLAAADGSGEWINLINDDPESFDDEFSPAWHPEGSLLAIFTDRFLPPMGSCRGNMGVHHLAFIPLDGERSAVQHFDALAGEQNSLAWSPDGRTLAFSSICTEQNVRIYLYDRETGEIRGITEDAYASTQPAFSPDGRTLAFSSSRDGPADILLYNLQTGEMANLTRSEARERYPTWSPDGRWIAFTSDALGNDDIWIIGVDGSGLGNLTNSPGNDLMPNWSPAD